MSAASARKKAYTRYNEVAIIRGGADYFARIEQIAASAKYSLHLQTYIFDDNETGRRVANALMSAARRGVLVYLMVDGYASQGLGKEFIAQLRNAGVHFRFFSALFRGNNYYFGRRMHHKLVVADGHTCLVGGLNISDRYNDMPGAPAWLDWALHVTGEVAADVDKVCIRMWNRSVFSRKCKAVANPIFPLPTTECLVRIRRNDWVNNKIEITRSYAHMFAECTREAIVMTSYFWPPEKLLRRMEAAVKRGVAVKLILTGSADVPLAKYAERYLYRRLFRNHIRVFEYTANVLHGKTAVMDGTWFTLGSYNLNNISQFASIELNLDVANAPPGLQRCSICSGVL